MRFVCDLRIKILDWQHRLFLTYNRSETIAVVIVVFTGIRETRLYHSRVYAVFRVLRGSA
jgi:hypothetical protein